MKKHYLALLVGLFALPQISFADACSAMSNDTFSEIVSKVICIINNSLIPLGFAIATLFFIYGVVSYVVKGDDEEARKKGREFIIWGIVAMFMMVSIFGFVKLLQNTVQLPNDTDTPIEIPEAPFYE